jgi:hypothetical protein
MGCGASKESLPGTTKTDAKTDAAAAAAATKKDSGKRVVRGRRRAILDLCFFFCVFSFNVAHTERVNAFVFYRTRFLHFIDVRFSQPLQLLRRRER